MRILDAHVHLWDVDQVTLRWFRPELGLPERVSADDFARASVRAGVGGAVAVQAADTSDEVRWLAGQISSGPLSWGLVVQFEPHPADPLRWAGALYDPRLGHRIAGVRAAVPARAADLSDVPGLDALAAGLAASRRVLEMLVRPDQLDAVARLARRHPTLSIVVCHLGVGAGGADATWRGALERLACEDGVAAKVSGLHPERRTAGDLAAMLAHAFDVFGAERLLFGSDWPLSTRETAYDAVLQATADALPALTTEQRTRFWRANAAERYGVALSG